MTINPYTEEVQFEKLKNADKPYTYLVNRSTLVEQVRQLWHDVADIEADFCPENFAQASITMHPAFASQQAFPEKLLQLCGLFCVGTKRVSVFPRFSYIGTDDETTDETSIAIIVVAKRQTFQAMASKLEEIDENSLAGQQLMTIESIESVTPYDRMDIPNDYFDDIYLVGLYPRPGLTAEGSKADFTTYAESFEFEVNPDFFYEKDSLYYVLIRGARYKLDSISENPFVSTIQVPPKKVKS